MNIESITFDEKNEKARELFRKEVDRHIKELKAAYDEYLDSDADKSEKRQIELDQYLWEGCKPPVVYAAVTLLLHREFPRPPKPAPEFKSVAVPVVESLREAKRKGLTSFVTITPGPRAEVPRAWQDPNIEWSGYSVTEIVPNLEDNNRPARMTEDGKIYYR